MRQTGLAVLLFVLGVSSAQAQMTFGGGAAFGISSWGYNYQFAADPQRQEVDLIGSGFIFGGHGVMNINKFFSVRLNLDYSTYSADTDVLGDVAFRYLEQFNPGIQRSTFHIEGNDASVFAITANAIGKYPLGAFAPYALAGIGVHIASFSDVTAQYGTQPLPTTAGEFQIKGKTSFCFNGGLGVEYRLKFMRIFLELYYSGASESSYMPFMVGATYTP